jgi:NitT/TauT family transport system ATP-binding protein
MGQLSVYEDFNLEVAPGTFLVLLGPSGCGKSTLLNLMDGLMMPTSADSVRVLDRDIRRDPSPRRQIAYVFQNARLLPWRTLRRNVELALEGMQTQPRAEWGRLTETYFRIARLSEYMDYYPHQVSGGMNSRAAIVRAWVNEPQILLMDEPFSQLDELTAAELRRELSAMWSRDRVRRTVVFVTHDIHEAALLGQEVVMLTHRPARVCHREVIDLPWPRDPADERVFAVETKLRKVFAESVGMVPSSPDKSAA